MCRSKRSFHSGFWVNGAGLVVLVCSPSTVITANGEGDSKRLVVGCNWGTYQNIWVF